MPRISRKESPTGIYHIIGRGVNRQTIFEEDADRKYFLKLLYKYKGLNKFTLYAYCLMNNHFHLLIKADKGTISEVMQKINCSYAMRYNNKYGRVGHLFQARYKSEPITDYAYFLTALRYIFQNPVKARIVSKIDDYPWTNYPDYIGDRLSEEQKDIFGILRIENNEAKKRFFEFMNVPNRDKCLEAYEEKKMTDKDAAILIAQYCGENKVTDIKKLKKEERNKYLRELKSVHGLSIRQIERITGIGRGIVQNV